MRATRRKPGVFGRIGRFSYLHRRWVVAGWLILVLVALPTLPDLHSELRVGGFSSDETEGAKARALLERELGFSPSSMAVIYRSNTLDPSDERFLQAVDASLAEVRDLEFVTTVLTPRDDPSLIAPSGTMAYAVVGLNVGPEEAQRLVPEFEQTIQAQPNLEMR